MEKFIKGLKIARFVLYALVVALVALQFLARGFLYAAIVAAALIFVDLCALEVILYRKLKRQIENGYSLYLQDKFVEGLISKEQLDRRDRAQFGTYSKMFKANKWKIFLLFILFFCLTVTLLTTFIKLVF